MTAPRTIARARLRRAGPPGADAIDWTARAAIGALVLAAVWTLWAVVRPLPEPTARDTAEPSVAAPLIEFTPESVEQRRARLDDLARQNRFAAGGLAWKPRVEPSPEAPAEPGTDGASPSAVATVAPTAPVDPELTPPDRIPDDVKKALAAIELRGLRTDNEGRSVAMISRVHNSQRSASTPYRVGDEFEEESNNQAKWRVIAIDWLQRRVLLLRSGVKVALPLYKGEATLAAATASRRAEAEAPVGTVAGRQEPDPQRKGVPGAPAVVIQDRAAAIAELRAAGVSEEDIAAIVAALDQPLPARVAEPAADDGAPAQRAGPPPGMEAILKMMQEQAKQGEETQGEQPPRRSKRRPRPPN